MSDADTVSERYRTFETFLIPPETLLPPTNLSTLPEASETLGLSFAVTLKGPVPKRNGEAFGCGEDRDSPESLYMCAVKEGETPEPRKTGTRLPSVSW